MNFSCARARTRSRQALPRSRATLSRSACWAFPRPINTKTAARRETSGRAINDKFALLTFTLCCDTDEEALAIQGTKLVGNDRLEQLAKYRCASVDHDGLAGDVVEIGTHQAQHYRRDIILRVAVAAQRHVRQRGLENVGGGFHPDFRSRGSSRPDKWR